MNYNRKREIPVRGRKRPCFYQVQKSMDRKREIPVRGRKPSFQNVKELSLYTYRKREIPVRGRKPLIFDIWLSGYFS